MFDSVDSVDTPRTLDNKSKATRLSNDHLRDLDNVQLAVATPSACQDFFGKMHPYASKHPKAVAALTV